MHASTTSLIAMQCHTRNKKEVYLFYSMIFTSPEIDLFAFRVSLKELELFPGVTAKRNSEKTTLWPWLQHLFWPKLTTIIYL